MYKTIIWPVVRYGCENLSPILREEPRVFENRVLKRLFGPKRNEMAGGRRKPGSKDLRDLYSSSSKIRMIKSRKMRWSGHVARMKARRNVHRRLVRKLEGKRQLGRH
jgi:hypothetical protein